MKPATSKIWFLKQSVLIFSIGYLLLSVATTVHIILLKESWGIAVFAIYCYTQVCVNWKALYFFSSKDSGTQGAQALDSSPYSYCPDCNIFKHKYSHHCPICEQCVLRHDHHCFFLGTCIGLKNQGYFIILCLYIGLGSLYLAIQIFLTSDWIYNNWYNYLELFMPFGFVISLMRATSLTSACMIMFYNISVVIGMFCIYMCSLQIYLLSRHLTWHEFNTNVRPSKDYQLTLWHNFKSNFARFGLKRFLIPIIPISSFRKNPVYCNSDLV